MGNIGFWKKCHKNNPFLPLFFNFEGNFDNVNKFKTVSIIHHLKAIDIMSSNT